MNNYQKNDNSFTPENYSCQDICSETKLFPDNAGTPLTEEQKIVKLQIYEQMKPRRRKFIDKIGYDNWNPFQAPKDPLDIRKDISQRTIQELVAEYMQHKGQSTKSAAWQNTVKECATGIITQDEKYQAIFDFCLWYYRLLKKEGHIK